MSSESTTPAPDLDALKSMAKERAERVIKHISVVAIEAEIFGAIEDATAQHRDEIINVAMVDVRAANKRIAELESMLDDNNIFQWGQRLRTAGDSFVRVKAADRKRIGELEGQIGECFIATGSDMGEWVDAEHTIQCIKNLRQSCDCSHGQANALRQELATSKRRAEKLEEMLEKINSEAQVLIDYVSPQGSVENIIPIKAAFIERAKELCGQALDGQSDQKQDAAKEDSGQ